MLKLVILFYAGLVTLTYQQVINPILGAPFIIADDFQSRIVTALGLIALVTVLTPRRMKKPSDLFVIFYAINPIIPVIIIYMFQGQHFEFLVASVGTHVMFYIFTRSVFARRSIGPSRGQDRKFVRNFSLIYLVLIAIGSLYVFGLPKLSIELVGIYQERLELRDVLENLNFFLRYGIGWASAIFLPILMIISLKNRSFVLFSFSVLFSFFMYSTYLEKYFLFVGFYALTIYILSKKYNLYGIVYLYSFILIISILMYISFDNKLFAILFPRRIIYITAILSYEYYELFSEIGNVYLSSSILRNFIEYPFDIPPSRLIGVTYYGSVDTNANTGLLGTGYMHFGFYGMYLFIGILVLLAKLIDALPISKDAPVFAGSVFLLPMGNIMVSADFFSGLLTGGVIVLLALFICDGLLEEFFPTGARPKQKPTSSK